MKSVFIFLVFALTYAKTRTELLRGETSPKKLKVLYVGNSYTSGLPIRVKKLAQSQGLTLKYQQAVRGGYTFAKHSKGDAAKKIKQGGWDVVVLQEQSLFPTFSHNYICGQSQKWAKELANLVKTHNPDARIVWYQTWGRRDGIESKYEWVCPSCKTFEAMQDVLTSTYSTYACEFKPGNIAPVGEAYRIFKNDYPDEFNDLYSRDGSHPSSGYGRYLGGCVHFSTLFGQPCTGNSYTNGLSVENATNIQTIADEAVFGGAGNWFYDETSDCSLSFTCS